MSTAFQAGKVLYSQQSALSQLIGVYNRPPPEGGAPGVAAWLGDPTNMNEVANLSGALNLWASQQPQEWPTPPGVPPLNAAQKEALFAAQCGVGPMSAFIELTPGMTDDQRNVYKQFYGVSGEGWGEVQYWYEHRAPA